MTFLIATGNMHKYTEISRMLEPLGIGATMPAQAGVHLEVEETGATFEENARLKAEAYCKASGMPAVADDSGLEVDALNGAPGVYSARYAGEGASDLDRIHKLLSALDGVPDGRRGARFVSVLCCVFPDGRVLEARGECEGSIGYAPLGEDGFGYDPIFVEAASGKTFAQLSAAEKDAVSHRGKALAGFVRLLGAEFQTENH